MAESPVFPSYPPGPASFAARLAVAHGQVGAESSMVFRLPESFGPNGNAQGWLWAFSDFEQTAGTRWWSGGNGVDGAVPVALHIKTDGIKRAFWPLIFVVRIGHEQADYAALRALVERDGLKPTDPLHSVFSRLISGGRQAVCVAALLEEGEAEGGNNG